ncbi:MAG: hybrid sensor histidine kinase/response regulator [Halobacteriaceae archaeon]
MKATLRALLVEDNPGDARLVRHHLGDDLVAEFVGDLDVVHVETLADAVAELDGEGYHVVLLDLGLTETTGLDTLDRVAETAPDVPVVVLTGNRDNDVAVEAIRRGAQDYLTKDRIDPHTLARSLRYAVERRRQERELERQNERLEEFAGLVSHDIRNPLNVAQGHLELAREECDDGGDHLDTVAAAHGRMVELVEDVLTLARKGETVSEVEPVALSGVVETARTNTGVGDALTVVDSLPVVEADPERLCTVFENLFRNAVDHGGEDVHIRVGVLDSVPGFYVEDDGLGIPPESLSTVFEPGYTTAASGTGFGLAIVERIVEAHGWSVEPTRATGGGARFEVTVPEWAVRSPDE